MKPLAIRSTIRYTTVIMFFNVRGICRTVTALVAVAILCLIDLKCSQRRDAHETGTINRVRGELAAGKKELASWRAENIRTQIRNLRIEARRLVEKGRVAEARRLIAEIQDLERALPADER